MCGIGGELRLDDGTPNLQSLSRMMQVLSRRGPDDVGDYVQGRFACGQRRLAVIDLSPRAHQPMVDNLLGLVIVFNGTIYNYRELRQQLVNRGYQFFSEGDTEVILKAYAEWGEDCVTRLQGMFAFAVWNMQTPPASLEILVWSEY